MPRIAATRSSCSGLVKVPSRNGRALREVRQSASREPREPPPVVGPLLGCTASPASPATSVERVEARRGPSEPRSGDAVGLEPHPLDARTARRVRRARRAADRPAAAARCTRRSSVAGQPPMPRLPSSSSAVPHRPAAGHAVEDRPLEHRRAAAARQRQRRQVRRRCRASRLPRRASASTWRPGPHPTSSTGRRPARGAARRRPWPGSTQRRPSSRTSRGPTAERSTALHHERRAPARDARVDGGDRAAKRDPGPSRGDGTGVVEVVDVAQLGEQRVRRPSCRSRSSWRRPGLAASSSGPRRRPGHGPVEPEAPPARRRPRDPSTASTPVGERCASASREVGGRELRRVHADEERGSVDRGERGREPVAETTVDLRQHVERRRAARARSDRRARGRAGAPAPRATVSSVSASAAAAIAAACSGVHGGQRRVFTRPAAATWRARARWRRCRRHRSTPAMSWTARIVPATVPVTFERPMRGE